MKPFKPGDVVMCRRPPGEGGHGYIAIGGLYVVFSVQVPSGYISFVEEEDGRPSAWSWNHKNFTLASKVAQIVLGGKSK